jgi:hypothetical protein
MDRPDIGRVGQQVVGDEKKELEEIFEDVWYICAMARRRNCHIILVSKI